MRNIAFPIFSLVAFFSILLISCNESECYECIDNHAFIEVNETSGYDIYIPNAALEGEQVIDLIRVNRLDQLPYSLQISELNLSLNNQVIYAGSGEEFQHGSELQLPVTTFEKNENELFEGQIDFNLIFTESLFQETIKINGSFLYLSCSAFNESTIKNMEECRYSLSTTDGVIFGKICP